jgi:hypothetical protein
MAKNLLPDKNLLDELLDPEVPEPDPFPAPIGEYMTVQSIALSAPYEIPGETDMTRIRSLVQAQLSEAQDHLWSLREDPAYFADCLLNWAEHSVEMVFDKHWRGRPDQASSPRTIRLWDEVLNKAIHISHQNVYLWRTIGHLLDEVLESQATSDAARLGRSQELENALLRLTHIVESNLTISCKIQINMLLPPSPPLRYLFQPVDYRTLEPRRD